MTRLGSASPLDYPGEPIYYCHGNGGCELVGATIITTFDLASVTVDPPVGDRVTVDFDLTGYR